MRKRWWSSGDDEVVAQTLTTGTRKVLLRDAVDARFVATGHLVFLRRGVLFAVAFDPERLEVRGTPTAVFDGVVQALAGLSSYDATGAGQFAVASTGNLAWVRGPLVAYSDRVLVSVDRHGQVSRLAAPVKSYGLAVRLGPGGRQLAVSVQSLSAVSLWTQDLARGTLTPLVQSGEAEFPVWTPDGQRLVFGWLKDGRLSLAWQRADGAAPPEVLAPGSLSPSSWAPDGRHLAVTTLDAGDLAVATVEQGRATVQPLTQTPAYEGWPEFSPDGHWLAYGSNVSGRYEVYVQPYPGPGPPTQVSVEGGGSPAWRANGHELFFLGLPDAAGTRRMMVAGFEPGPSPHIGAAQSLLEVGARGLHFWGMPVRCFDVAPDGQRFYVVQTLTPPPAPVVTQINLVLNSFEELKEKVSVKR